MTQRINNNFQQENLVVDWISFKFQDLESEIQTEIVNHLFKIGFNSYQESGKLVNPIKESIRFSSQNKFQVIFIKEGPYWSGIKVNFSGLNASAFYTLIQKNLVDWKVFSSGVLCRFDLYFCHPIEPSGKYFFDNCQRELKEKNKKFSFEKNSKGPILKIGSRRSNNYCRLYESSNSLKFELEVKGKFIQDCHLLLVSNSLEEFEQKLSSHFLNYFAQLLPLWDSSMDWLVKKLRLIKNQSIMKCFLNTDYMNSNQLLVISDQEKLVAFLQLLIFSQKLDFEMEYLGSIAYRQVIFQVKDFLTFRNPTIKYSTSYYQLRKLLDFLSELQKNFLLTSFNDKEFQSLVAVPQVKLSKCNRTKCWIAKVWLVEELFSYKYPFQLPDFFQKKMGKDELAVKVRFMQVFTSRSVKKIFLVQNFFESYPAIVSNQQKAKMKRYFLESVTSYKEHGLIKSNYKVISNGVEFETEQLTITNISEGFILYENLLF